MKTVETRFGRAGLKPALSEARIDFFIGLLVVRRLPYVYCYIAEYLTKLGSGHKITGTPD